MEIYQLEIEDGLEKSILANASVINTSEVRALTEGFSELELAKATNLNQPDLFYNKSILVTTGFNLNMDFFPVIDTWLAKSTIIDKPSCIEHNRHDVIGHSTEAVCVDDYGVLIDENVEGFDINKLQKFNIVDASVIYTKGRGSEEKDKRVSKIVEEIVSGKYWVSMEAFFKNFDYILFPKTDNVMEVDISKAEIIKRTKDTAYMTKFLRAYNEKADNTYKGKMIGRVLRDITFAGKAYTKNPANPNSLIYTFDGQKLSGKLNTKLSTAVYSSKEGNKKMEELDTLKKTNEELNATIASLKAELEASKKSLETIGEENKKTIAEFEKIKTDLASANKILDEIKDKERFTSIVTKVKAVYASITDEKAVEVANTLKPLTDEQVEANLNTVASLKPVETPKAPEVPAVASIITEKPAVETPTPVETPKIEAGKALASVIVSKINKAKGKKK